MNTEIELLNVEKSYGKNKILNGLSFSISKHEFVGLIGNNGCGKTTTINCLCNLTKYDRGVINFLGNKVVPNYVSYKNEIGLVLSNHYFVDDFNIIQYWKFICKFQKVPQNEINNRINDLVGLLDLVNDKNKQIKHLSSGSKKKVAIGAALIHNPKILILDEPFINLDIKSVESVKYLLKNLHSNKTLLITSHNLELVVDICDRFLIMDNGIINMDIKKTNVTSLDEIKSIIKDNLKNNEFVASKLDWLK